jgi:hypothetical protein
MTTRAQQGEVVADAGMRRMKGPASAGPFHLGADYDKSCGRCSIATVNVKALTECGY